jgi:hypothetical protein
MIRFASHVIPVGQLFPKADKKQKFVKVSQMGIGLSMLAGGLGKAVDMLASKLHEIWAEGTRAILMAKGAPLERFKDDGEGGQIDILNTSYAELTPKWQAENKAQAQSAIGVVSKNMDSAIENIEELSAQVHEQWLSRNSWAIEQKSSLAVPYSELPEEEKQKDRDVITAAHEILSQMMGGEEKMPEEMDQNLNEPDLMDDDVNI